jgi:hypothetical protein
VPRNPDTPMAPDLPPGTGAPKEGSPEPTPSPSEGCHPSYSPCIPNDGHDVDCEGGSGDGPSYVRGPVKVNGFDEYRLDRDGDGIACERE